jgi:LPXTG-site transpeptidase (sortase) family protein
MKAVVTSEVGRTFQPWNEVKMSMERLALGRRLKVHTSMRGAVGARPLIGMGCLGLVAAAALGFFVFKGGSDEETPVVQETAPATVAVTAPPPAEVERLGESFRMIIEKIGVDAPVASYGLDENRIPIVPTGPDASQVVAWYDFSEKPGNGGNAVFAGHVTWNGQAVFYNLTSVQAGDIIKFRDNDGREVSYRVTSNASVDPNDPNALQMLYPTSNDVVTIITCGGSFYSTGDPVFGGDYTNRIIVRGERVS